MRRIKNYQQDIRKFCNSGSTLVTVIVIVAFMSILATVMLYLSGENYKMKAMDLKNKSSFYEAEEVMELLKTQLALDVAGAAKPAFTQASANYIKSANKNIRAEEFYEAYKTNYARIWRNHWYSTVGGAVTLDLNKGITELFPGATSVTCDYAAKTASFVITINGVDMNCTLENFGFDNAVVIPGSIYDAAGKINIYHLYGSYTDDAHFEPIRLTVTDNKSFTSIISTSFEIIPPTLNWGDAIDNPDAELDYTQCIKYYGWSKE